MLTGLLTAFGLCVLFTVGAALSDYTPLGDLIDELTKDMPMNWFGSEHEDSVDR